MKPCAMSRAQIYTSCRRRSGHQSAGAAEPARSEANARPASIAISWVIMDTPPLLFAADASLLSTMSHGTLLVVRIGHTTIDSVTRAMQSLCNNNVLGIVVNGARRGELYSKYTYYHSYYTPKEEPAGAEAEPVPVAQEDDDD